MSDSSVPYGFVRGGTLTTAYENELRKQKAEAEARRDIDARRREFVANSGGEAKLHSLKTGSDASVVLVVKHPKDSTILDYITCEILVGDHQLADGTQELILNMACPKCYATRGISDNFKIHQSNRRFEFEAGKIPRALEREVVGGLWVNPVSRKEAVTIAGTINLYDKTRCPNLGCTYEFVIEDSVLRSV